MEEYKGLRSGDLSNLVEQLKEEQIVKRDLIVPSHLVKMTDGKIIMDDLPSELFKEEAVRKLLDDFNIDSEFRLQFNPMKNAETNMSQKLKIPVSFYRYLKEDHQDMLDYNITELFRRLEKPMFIRTFAPTDGDTGLLRAVLSNRYKVIDHLDILTTTLKSIKDSGVDVKIGKCNLTETSMYVEFYSEQIQADYQEFIRNYKSPDGEKNGSILAGFVISNSEVGAGKYKISPRMVMTVCNNGMIRRADAMEHTHLGSKMESGIVWSSDTKKKELDLILSQVQDAVKTFLSEDYLGEFIDEILPYTEKMNNPVPAVENICKTLQISEDEQMKVLNHFLDSGDFSPFGATQAITYYAHEHSDAERQYELETKSFELLPDIPDHYDIREKVTV